MRYSILSCCTFLMLWCLLACNSSHNELTINTTSPARLVSKSTPPSQETFKIKAKFIDFEMGDVAHYLFEDEQGEIWDFTDCTDQDLVFENSLPEAEHDDFNKGWGSNALLQGRWFLLECGTSQQALYPNGPEDITQVINDAILLY